MRKGDWMDVRPGSRWISQVCETEVVVVRGSGVFSLECGGHPMVPPGEAGKCGATLDPEFAAGSYLGKRFVSDQIQLEVLVTRAGAGSMTVDSAPLILKNAKSLPSAD